MNILVEGTYESLLEKFTEDKDVTNVLRELHVETSDRHYKGMFTLRRTVFNGDNVRQIVVMCPPIARQWTVATQENINTPDHQ